MHKIKTFILILFIQLIATNLLNAQEYYFRFIEKDIKKVNTVITSTVSIDDYKDGLIHAYANPNELKRLLELGYNPEMLPHPSSLTRVLNMATTVDQMENWDRYPTYQVYREMMKNFEKDFPEICKLDSIGTTVEGRKLYVLKISDNVGVDEAEPEFFYTSTIHGDEATGYILMLRLADYLLSNYGTDERIDNLVNNMSIFINPNANPDGTYNYGDNTVSGATRSNANGVDVNRNFPDPREGSNPNGPHQPETIAMMDFAESRNFILSANFHGGIELVNFPWDSWTSNERKHADHNWFYTISRQYADLAHANSPSTYFTSMDNGVTHGGDWYVISGGRQDYMNYFHNCREITLEISDTKLISSDLLPAHWNYNKESMLTYMELVFAGFKGTVTNLLGEPLDAVITIQEHDKDNSFVVSNPMFGNYYRMIEPGTWQVSYSAEGYITQTHTITIDDYESVVTKDVVLYTTTSIPMNRLYEPEVKTYPNPFSDQLTISVDVDVPTMINIEVFNFAGQKIGTVVSSIWVDNEQTFFWDVSSKSLSKGIYFIRVKTNEAMVTKKVSLL